MKPFRFALLSLMAFWLCCAPATAATPTPVAPSAATPMPAGPVSEVEQYLAIVRKLASDEMEGRAPGTPGIVRARDYVAGRFESLGMRPAFDGGRSYLQPLQIRLGMDVKKAALSVGGGDAKFDARAGADFNVLGFSGSRAFEGEAVMVGYCIDEPTRKYDSFAGVAADALKGKVLVAFRFEPQDAAGHSRWTGKEEEWTRAAGLTIKARHAQARGAAALLLVNPPSPDKEAGLHTADSTVGPSVGGMPVMQISSALLARIVRAAGRESPAAAIADWQKQADAGTLKPASLGVTLTGQADLSPRMGTVHNVAAVLPGAGKLDDQWIIVGGHYDHLGASGQKKPDGTPIYLCGADDNASGSAGVLTLARRMAASDKADSAPADRRSVLFVCFTGEEVGLLGSAYLAGHLDQAGIRVAQVAAMVNLDMIGRMKNDQAWVLGGETSAGWAAHVKAAAEGSGIAFRVGGSGAGGSDQSSFASRGIPVAFFFTGMHKDAHHVTDTADRINGEGAVKLLGVTDRLIASLRAEPERMIFVQPRGEPGAYLGIVPDPSGDGHGCAVTHVQADGPAAKGGLKDGDVIVGWNDTAIASFADLLAKVGQAKPGDTVTLKVRRDDHDLQLKVTLGAR
ncbi:MAG: hypothetical protein BIFFINMI_03511 [Phycisphaerae bacterium]|nr:hypothetical protein [Phycisphaerae bacterium]